jgi:hypothetical protein
MRISARRMRNAWVVVLAVAVGGGVEAQDTARSPSPLFVGSEAENYLRYLQSLGEIPHYPWSMRGFSDADVKKMRTGSASEVWSAWPVAGARRGSRWGGVQTLPASASVIYNTLIPYGMNDGAVWAGRGLTVELRGGVTGRWGPLRVTLAPTAFRSENRAFGLMPVVPDSLSPFVDALRSPNVDRPQRFGNAPYGRIDPGQSGVRLEGLGAQIGFSWENRWWGPMSEFPYILGSNAGGFPHAFIGTSSPRDIWIGRLSAQVLYAQLSQTKYSPVMTGDSRRFASGMVIVFEPKPFPGLEIGGARFFHAQWPDSGLTSEYFTHLFETFIKARIGKAFQPAGPVNEKESLDNQLASVFGRWVFPHSGVEVYAEFGREDHNWDGRDLFVELDHSAAIGFGLRKAWLTPDGLRALRFESLNYQASTLQRHRPQGGAYYHSFTRQGHTERGQLLGTAAGVGNGAAAAVTYERIVGARVSRVSWSRLVTLDPDIGPRGNAVYVLSAERFRRRGSDGLRLGAGAILDMNHKLTDSDALSFRFAVAWTRF